jgi:predicted transcriptional regulator
MPRPRGERRTTRLSVSLDHQIYAELRALARRSDVSAAWMVRRAVAELLERASQSGQTLELPLPRRSV